MFELTDRVALVTGGSRGLGRAMVQAFAEAGADVVIASRNLASCETAALEVEKSTGRRALPVAFHAGHWDEAEPLVDRVLAEFGRSTSWSTTPACRRCTTPSTRVTEALWDKVFAVNLKGPFRLAAVGGHRMLAAGGGSIINISSMASVRPDRTHSRTPPRRAPSTP